ncbi:MAG: hypothetical protein H6903_08470 [Rhodobacteraceae bacterium]|nr:hypothetical protein [Defluviimonas sp.]MCP5355219.1 hypothetical protein [Paracoccaceae bacterium]
MPIVSAPAENMGGDFIFGLGIKEIDANQRHCGVIYRPDAEVVRFLHLAFHFDLRDEALNGTYWWAPSGLDPENQLVLAALANVIAEGHPSIPYGFDMDGLIFDKATGALLPAPPGRGLTCATFVLAMLQTYGFEPILSRSWEVRHEDEQWQDQILAYMQERGASPEHLDAIRSAESNKRFRPEEVVGTAAQQVDEWAIEFERAQLLAAEVLRDMAG